jgi:hypothetical protein
VRGAHILPNFGDHLKILGARRVTWSKFVPSVPRYQAPPYIQSPVDAWHLCSNSPQFTSFKPDFFLKLVYCSKTAFLKLFSSGDHFYWSQCSTDHPTLVPFESKLFEILNYSVWYAIHVNFIFSVFFGLMFNLRGPQGQNPRTTCGPRTTVWETLL